MALELNGEPTHRKGPVSASGPDCQGGAGQVRNRRPGTVIAQSRPGVPHCPREVALVCRTLFPAYDSLLFPKKPILLVKWLFIC